MAETKSIEAINIRYSELAEESCCLSCGGAIDKAEAQPGERCADLGSGRGQDVLKLADQVGAEGYVYGLDISEGMIRKARKNAEKFEVSNVKFLQTDLENLPLDDEALDLVISNCTINHASDKQAVWNEIFRVLNKGGRFIISDIYSIQEVPEKYRTDPEAIAECWAGSVTKEVYMDQLFRAGFRDITVLEESRPYAKGEIEVSSWTLLGFKPRGCGCSNK